MTSMNFSKWMLSDNHNIAPPTKLCPNSVYIQFNKLIVIRKFKRTYLQFLLKGQGKKTNT